MTTLLKHYRRYKNKIIISPVIFDKKFCFSFSQDFQTANMSRIQFFSSILFVLNSFLLWRDVYITKTQGLWEENPAYYYLFICHCVLEIGVVLFYLFSKYAKNKIPHSSRPAALIVFFFGLFILLWSSAISGWITQKIHGQITEYIIAVFGIASVFAYRPNISIPMFGVGLFAFLAFLFANTANPNANGHVTNSIVLTILAWSFSRVMYVLRLREFTNRHTIEVQKKEIEMANIELQQRNEYLAELNNEKNEFLGIAAHDLKNPLASVMLSAETLIRYNQSIESEQRISIAQAIFSTAKRMNTIVRNLLDVNAIESGKITVQYSLHNPVTTLQELLESFRDSAANKEIEIVPKYNVSEALIAVDISLFHEILENLVSNAVKYSPKGKKIFLRTLNSYDELSLRIEVEDQGQGLTAEDKLKVFGKFQRLSAQPTGGEHSTGLGLAIAKKLTETMNGRIMCDSEYGHGATFAVEFPIV